MTTADGFGILRFPSRLTCPSDCSEFAGLLLGSFHLTGTGVSTLTHHGLMPYSGIALSQLYLMLSGHSFVVQSCIGGIGDRFFLNGGIDDDLGNILEGQCLAMHCGFDDMLEELLHAIRAHAFAPFHQTGGMTR
jgi:hypothetical protein